MKTKEEILKNHFIPVACSDAFFEYCLRERKASGLLSSVSQALEAMIEFSEEQTKELKEERERLRESMQQEEILALKDRPFTNLLITI